jgi:hypothetical protein
MVARLVEVRVMPYLWQHFNTFVYRDIRLYFCVKLIRSFLVRTDLLTGAMHGSLTPTLNMLEPINGGHSRLVPHFPSTIVKEMRIDTSFNLLLITLLVWTN